MPMDSLLGPLESIRSCVCVKRACVRTRIGNSGERTNLSTGNKLTSCRKLANVPWEDSSRERATVLGGGGETLPASEENKKLSFTQYPKMRIRLSKIAGEKIFYSREFIIHDEGFCGKCARGYKERVTLVKRMIGVRNGKE